MIRRPPRSTRTDTLFPYTTLFRSWVHFALAAVAAGIIGYVFGQHDLLTSKRASLPNDMDFVVAWAFLLLCPYASLREWGGVVSLIAVVGLFYGYFGDLMPVGLFYHGGTRLSRLICYTSNPYLSGLTGGCAELRSEERGVGKESVGTSRSR